MRRGLAEAHDIDGATVGVGETNRRYAPTGAHPADR
jgi:hypothetical protein